MFGVSVLDLQALRREEASDGSKRAQVALPLGLQREQIRLEKAKGK